MAIYGVRVKGSDDDVMTIQVRNNKHQKSNADKAVREYKRIQRLDADKEYETHFLFLA